MRRAQPTPTRRRRQVRVRTVRRARPRPRDQAPAQRRQTTAGAQTTVVAPMMAPAALPASTRAVPRARRVPQASTSQVPVSREVRALHAALGIMLQPRARHRARLAQPERQQRTLARTFVLRALVGSIHRRLAPRGARAAWRAHISHRREVHEKVPTRVTLILLF